MVKGTFFNAGQYQIILGTGIVNKVYGEMEGLGLNTLSKQGRWTGKEPAKGRQAA